MATKAVDSCKESSLCTVYDCSFDEKFKSGIFLIKNNRRHRKAERLSGLTDTKDKISGQKAELLLKSQLCV